MNMFKRLMTAVVMVAVFFVVVPGPGLVQAQLENHTKIFVVVDDSNTAWDQEAFEKLKARFMVETSKLRENVDHIFTSLDVIVTSTGRNVFSGKINQLRNSRHQQSEVMALKASIQSKANHCNDLAAAFATLEKNITLLDDNKFTDVKIYFLSNLYDTGAPCDFESELLFPAPPPANVDFVRILTLKPSVNSIAFYGVHESEMEIWSKTLSGLLDWEKEGRGRTFSMYDEAQTVEALKQGLEGITR